MLRCFSRCDALSANRPRWRCKAAQTSKETAFLECHYRNVFELGAASDVALLHLVAPPASFQLRVLMSLRLLLAGCQAAACQCTNSRGRLPACLVKLGSLCTCQHVGVSCLSLFVAINVALAKMVWVTHLKNFYLILSISGR